MTFHTFFPETMEELQKEATRAYFKHGYDKTHFNPDLDMRNKLTNLVEEIGEVARALTYDNFNLDNLRKELIQVANLALAWAQALDKEY